MGKKSRRKRELREKIENKEIQPKEKKERGIVSILLGIIRWATYLILFAPLIVSGKYFFPFVGPKSLYFMALAEIIFAVWLVLIVLSPEYRPRLNVLLISIIFFLVALILSSLFGADPSRSFWSKYERMTGLLMWFHLFAFFLVLSSVFKKKEDWFKIFATSIFVAILISFVSLLGKFSPHLRGVLAVSRGGSTIGNSSFFGTYLLFNIFLGIYLLFQSREALKVYSGVSLVIMLPMLVLISARAATISTLGGIFLLFLFWLIFSKSGGLRLTGIILLSIFIILGFLLTYLALQPGNFVYQKITQMATKSRLVIWHISWQGFKDRPLLGWGPENFELAFDKYFDPRLFLRPYGEEIWFDRAHNIIFDTLVASGVVGLFFYVGIFLAVFYALLRNFFRKKIGFSVLGIVSAALIAYFVQNLTVFDMINSYMMWFVLLAFVAAVTSQGEAAQVRREERVSPLKTSLISIILIAFCFSFFNFAIQPLRADADVIRAITAPSSSQRVALYEKTLKTSPLGKYQIRGFFADKSVSFIRSKSAKSVPLSDLKREMDFITGELEKSIKESPLDYKFYLKLGQAYNLYGRVDRSRLARAETVLERAIELGPKNPQGYWALAQTRLYQGKVDEALSLAEKSVDLEPRIINSQLIVVQIAEIKGDKKLAERKAEEAIKINPSWAPQFKKMLGKEVGK